MHDDFYYNSVKKEERDYSKKLKQTGGGPPPSPPKFSEEHDLLSETLAAELKMGQKTFDTFSANSATAKYTGYTVN
ncbi:hypothetical protein E2C01_095884 [Portunus trituberculatus]|uniref:Uncharacterized protein n=1 Tax=Portunus trituberculatus TaxID=210409 RepID=A0A5B7K1B3_PORTR|nr:hypothetical protein [Portunus trituberculatus]